MLNESAEGGGWNVFTKKPQDSRRVLRLDYHLNDVIFSGGMEVCMHPECLESKSIIEVHSPMIVTTRSLAPP